MKPGVKCVVDTCTHYLYGDRCGAGNIDIMHEAETRMSETAEQTMCKTFTHARNIFSYLGSLDNVSWTGSALGMLDPTYNEIPSISCTVAFCHYWGEGAICLAEEISVSGSDSNECHDTNCQTFIRRDEHGI